MAIWFFIFERLNMCTALICVSPGRASKEERLFCALPRCEIYLARLFLCVNTYVPQTQRWRRSGDSTHLLS